MKLERAYQSPQSRVTYLHVNDPQCRTLADHGILQGGLSHMRVRYVSTPEHLSAHRVMFTLGGRAELHTEVGVWSMVPGMVHVLPAGYSQWQVLVEDGEWDVAWFHLRDGPQWSSLTLHRVPHAGVSQYGSQLAATIMRYDADALHPTAVSLRTLPHLAHLIVLDLERELGATSDPDVVRLRIRFAQLWQEIAKQPARPWRVEEMAARCGFSAQYFRRVVRKHYGISPHQKLHDIRIGLAREFLLSTDWTLARIAEEVGYASPYALSAAFKRVIGLPPGQYRKSGSHLR